jgi:DNA phosphorothioation-dependent restriction protein DptH
MNNISQTLFHLVKEYYLSLDGQSNGDIQCRIVVPGLTPSIGEKLHRLLLADDLPSYFVIPSGGVVKPSEEFKFVEAAGLTSLRQGSMIIVTYPGEISNLQDSLVGAGGAIRSYSFMDEWPWVESQNTNFKFKSKFLDQMLMGWTTDPVERIILNQIICEGLIKYSEKCIDRSKIVLDEMLESFEPSPQVDCEQSVIDQFLFFCGIPKVGKGKELVDVTEYLKQIYVLARNINTQHEKTNARILLRERIQELFTSEDDQGELNQILSNIDGFFDGVNNQDPGLPSGVLTLRNCWDKSLGRWNCLDLDTLSNIYNIRLDKKNLLVDASIISSDGILSEDMLKGVLVNLNSSSILLKIDNTESSCQLPLKVSFTLRNKTLQKCSVKESLFSQAFSIADWPLPEKISNATIKIVIEDDKGIIVSEKKLSIHLVNDQNPYLVVVQNPFHVFKPQKNLEDSDATKISVDHPIDIFVVKDHLIESGDIFLDGDIAELIPSDQLGRVLRLRNAIDPDESPSGIRYFEANLADESILFSIEATDALRGEFNLESEYVSQIRQSNKSNVSKLVKIFNGEVVERYPSLGGIDDYSRKVSFLADIFESSAYRGEPILFDTKLELANKELSFGCWDLTKGAQRGFQFNDQPADIQSLLDNYSDARAKFLEFLWSGFVPDKSRPMYAQYPVFIDSKSEQLEYLLSKYLDSYYLILDFLDSSSEGLEWDSLFLLSYRDCIQFVDNGKLIGMHLLGPWHPIVAAKRYMTQSAIHDCGRRLLSEEASRKFSKLIALLENHSPIRWLPSLAGDEPILEYAFISATSDPGWLVGLSQNGIADVEEFCKLMRDSLGLEISAFPLAREQQAWRYLKNFCSTFSGNRAITLHASSSYSSQKIYQSAQDLLYADGEITNEGMQLSGGVHLLLDNLDEIEPIEWRHPPICLYEPVQGEFNWPYSKDVELLPPIGNLKLSALLEKIPVARGDGMRCVFQTPARKVTKGRAGKHSSYEIEIDDSIEEESLLPSTFMKVLSRISNFRLENKKTVWSFQLPEILEYTWNILPGGHADPALFVSYISEGIKRHDQVFALWDYRVSITKKFNTFYILSRVQEDIRYALNSSPIFSGKGDIASALISDLGLVGIAVGGEAMRSQSHALGVIGLSAAIRMMTSSLGGVAPPLLNDKNHFGFLLPVDSFSDLLGGSMDDMEDSRRGDLVAVQGGYDEDSRILTLSFIGIECKYSSKIYPSDQVDSALMQAEKSFGRIDELARSARSFNAMPERLALAKLIEFGLRILSVSNDADDWVFRQSQIMAAIFSGRIIIQRPAVSALLFTTECDFDSAKFHNRLGRWVRLSPNHWPGYAESEPLLKVREGLSNIFNEKSDTAYAEGRSIAPEEVIVDGGLLPTSVIADKVLVAGVPEHKRKEVEAHYDKDNAPLRPILIGVNERKLPIFFDPQKKGDRIENYNIMITGSSGKGKTQLVKTITSEIRSQNKKIVMLDFKNDYSPDEKFLEQAKLKVSHIAKYGLPYNPLIPTPELDPEASDGSELLGVSQHITGVASILATCFDLGVQQEASLKEAIRECFEMKGIKSSGMVKNSKDFIYPDFNDVGIKLKTSNPLAYSRLDPLFDLEIFQAQASQLRFDSALNDSTVFNLSRGSESIKNALAQIFILSSHAYFNALPHAGALNLMFVFDEAHRVLKSEYLARFVRECRAYGVGIILSSQNPSDFQSDISASLATKIIHGNGPDRDKIRAISNLLSLKNSEEKVKKMDLFEAYISNSQIGTEFINTIPYPYYLVLNRILSQPSGIRVDQLTNISGLNENLISIGEILDRLKSLSLVEEVDGIARCIIH